jgi:hypothetical protein
MTPRRTPSRSVSRVLLAGLACAAAMAPTAPAAPRDPASVPLPALTRMDTLFLTAATGEPRFQAVRDSAQAALLAGDSLTLAWLVERTMRPGHRLTPRQNHYIERLFTLIADSGRHAASRRALARAVATAPHDTARARWLYIGSRLGDTAFRTVARPWLRDSSAAVRRMAVRVLGAYPHPDHLPLLWDGLEHVQGLERHMRLWALAEHASLTSTPAARARVLARLAPLLDDPHMYNRRLIRDLMLRAADGSWAPLRRAMPAHAEAARRREWWKLARESRGGDAFLRSERARMTEEERRVLGL